MIDLLRLHYYESMSSVSIPGSSTHYMRSDSGYIRCFDTVYADARSGAGSLTDYAGLTSPRIGQTYSDPNYIVYELFVEFDTSAVPSSATVTTATLSIYWQSDHSDTDFTINAYVEDWGSTLTTGDWVAGASLSGLTKVATLTTSGRSESQYHEMTDVALPANIVKAGTTRLVLASSRTDGGTSPTGEEFVYADGVPDSNPIKLDVEWTASDAATVHCSSASGGIDSYDTTYLTARSGGGAFVVVDGVSADAHEVGQKFATPNYRCYIIYLDFLLPDVPGGFKTATLSVEPGGDAWYDDDPIIEAKLYDWGASLTSGDWVAGADWDTTGTLVATFDTTVWATASGYMTFTSEAGFAGLLTPGTNNRLILATDNFADASVPADDEWAWANVNEPGREARLEVTW